MSAPTEWRRRLAGVGLIVVGVLGMGAAGWVYYDAWSTRQTWDASEQAVALARQEEAPTPIWIAPATPEPAAAQRIAPVPTAGVPVAAILAPEPTPVLRATADQLSLDAADFRFLDPPEPGAHARLQITATNHADVDSGRVLVGIASSWFDKYQIIGTAPAVSDDRTDDDGLRTFSFPPLPAGATASYELHVTATAEGTTPPAVKVLLDDSDLIGQDARLSTFAPPPRPGPVMTIDIPSLKLHSGVVQIAWEPPPFAVGQIKGSANVTQGNTVLVGHLTGAAGNVFAHLDQLHPGDEITTISRGLPYRFVVSQTFTGANTDAGPMQPADDPRLTLMTCAGVWNPLTHDYSERLWVVAEPPDRAAVSIAHAAATATAEATAAVAATATAVAAQPTVTPTPLPNAGEPSLPGGIGNTRVNLEKALGLATGETPGRLVVFRQPDREVHVRFTPDPPRAQMVAELFNASLSFEAAVRESRKLFPIDARPRSTAPEGNSQFIVERFESPSLATTLGGSGAFSVVYERDARGSIDRIVLGAGEDFASLLNDSRR